MNVFTATGNLGNNAEQRFTNDGKSIVNFSVAVKSGYGKNAATTWVKCGLWGKQGEAVLPYLTKGQLVGVSGELCLREYQNKDGSKGSSLEVNVKDLTLLGKKEEGASKPSAPSGGADELESDIPFLFNMNTLCDTMGRPTAYWRAKHGKVMSMVLANQTDF